jgi:hypothetical protein
MKNREKIREVIDKLIPTEGPIVLDLSEDNKTLKCIYPYSSLWEHWTEPEGKYNPLIVDKVLEYYNEYFDVRTGKYVIREDNIADCVEQSMINWVDYMATCTLPYKNVRKSSVYKWLLHGLHTSDQIKDIAISMYLHFYPLRVQNHPDFDKNFSGLIIALHGKYSTESKG